MIGRSESFGSGVIGNPARVSSSLSEDSATWNDRVGRTFTPASVLNTTVGSANGMDTSEYAQRLTSTGSLLPSGNGESQDTQKAIDRILLDGKQPIGTL